MIGTLTSQNPKDDYIIESLRDLGLRSFIDLSESSTNISSAKLLLVTKDDLTESEVEMVRSFLDNYGDVIVLTPCQELFELVGNWNSVEGVSGLLPNDHLTIFSRPVPILEPIHATEGGQSLLRTDNLKLPALVSEKTENTILFFSFSVSRNIYKIKQGVYDERYLAERKKSGGFAHSELNPLEMSKVVNQEVPCADLLSCFVLEKILTALHNRGIALPFLWNLPDSKDAAFLLTMDEDWVNAPVLADALNLFRDARIPLTLFITQPLDAHDDLNSEGLIDFSIHPYHKDDEFREQVLTEAIDFLPKPPTGFRNHRRLVEKPDMLISAERMGIQWESNHGVSNSTGYALGTGLPFRIVHGSRTFDVLEFPIHFEDDVYFTTCHELGFDGSVLIKMMKNALEFFHSILVFAFHPIHVFLNSSSSEEYARAKEEGLLDDMQRLMTFREPLLGKQGTRTLLERTLDVIRKNRERLFLGTIEDINGFWRRRAEAEIKSKESGFSISPLFKGLGIVVPFVDVQDLKDRLECSSARGVEIAGIQCTVVEPPDGAIKEGVWDLPNLGHANP